MVVAQARGVSILATAESKSPLAEYSPPQIKQALVGNGRAAKRQVQMMVRAVLGLEEVPRPNHAADALAAALCHLHALAPLRVLKEAADRQAGIPEEMSKNKILLGQQRSRRRRRR
ncbi:crossover junction endodeoxyribonuclease RuvC, partial [Candidatus Sumerlaeota bacterium]|nr:crossover junction endodeoxyribonuclease RuvC [Candidatus Sumerlaeota bacterium]